VEIKTGAEIRARFKPQAAVMDGCPSETARRPRVEGSLRARRSRVDGAAGATAGAAIGFAAGFGATAAFTAWTAWRP